MSNETTAPGAPPKRERYPPQIKYIIGNEACERFGYYGIVGILELYLTERMKLGSDRATEILHYFGTAVYFLPLLGGWLADRWLGRFKTILFISLFYCAGNATLALTEGNPKGLIVGLALIAFGSGGIKPCVSAFVGDQFRSDQAHMLTKVYGWFYWSVNLGATFAFLVIPYIRDQSGYAWAFGVPGISMGCATLIFWLGSKYYVKQPPAAQQHKPPAFAAVIWHALTNMGARKPGQRFLDVALGRFSPGEVDGVRAVGGIVMIFLSVPVFWALFNQSNSTWVLQGSNMTPVYLHASPTVYPDDLKLEPLSKTLKDPKNTNEAVAFVASKLSPTTQRRLAAYQTGTDTNLQQVMAEDLTTLVLNDSIYESNRFKDVEISGEAKLLIAQQATGTNLVLLNRRLLEDAFPDEITNKREYKIDGERMQAASSILVMILVPVMTLGVYPWMERRGWRPTALRRMSSGMVLGAFSFVISGLLQSLLDHGAVLNVSWQWLPYIPLEAGEVTLSATALEFAFSQAPPTMKSVITSFWLMTIAGGHFLVAVFTDLKKNIFGAGLNASQFYFFAVLMFVVAGVFIFCATRYKERQG